MSVWETSSSTRTPLVNAQDSSAIGIFASIGTSSLREKVLRIPLYVCSLLLPLCMNILKRFSPGHLAIPVHPVFALPKEALRSPR